MRSTVRDSHKLICGQCRASNRLTFLGTFWEILVVRQPSRVRIFRNTYFTGPRWLFRMVISSKSADAVLTAVAPRPGSPRSILAPSPWERLRRKLRPSFWPYIGDAEPWATAAEDGWYAPSTYVIDEPGPLLIRLMKTSTPADSVLDLGCNSGANLNFLYQAGYRNLYGVDASGAALAHFARTFSETSEVADIRHDLFQCYLLDCPDGMVDIVHSNGATLELVHPSFPIVAEICRVARRAVYVDIQERGHAYPRDYIAQFQRHGFHLVYCDRPLDLVNGSSILHFERVPK